MTEMLKKQSGGKNAVSTQKYLRIAAVRENTIVVKDGSLRAVLAVSSTNFALKSEDEQNALVSAYQNFVNSLDFPIQICVRSRVLDINGYLDKLRGLLAGQQNELLRIQMSEYIEYVGKLVEFANIMSKAFYVVVPYSAAAARPGLMSRLGRMFSPAAEVVQTREEFEEAKVKLEQRVDHVTGGLGAMGLRSMVLSTEELVELLYQSYNVDSSFTLHQEDLKNIQVTGTDK